MINEFLIFLSGIFFGFIFILFVKIKTNKNDNLNPESEKKFNPFKFFDLIKDEIIICNKKKEITYVNKSAIKKFGNDILNKYFSNILRDPDLIEKTNQTYKEKINTFIDIKINQPIFKAYKIKIFYIKDQTLQDDYTCMFIIRDLTDVEKASIIKSDFVANISHELRTPLQSFKLGIESIKNSLKNFKNNHIQNFINIVEKDTLRMEKLVSDLLILSKIEQQEHRIPKDRVNVSLIVKESLSILDPLIKKREMQIENKLENNLIVIGQAERLKDVFINILENSIKYSNPNKTIRIESQETEKKLEIKISDHGIGIAKEYIPRVTERFFRIDPEKSKSVGGTGLGLAIVKHIITQHRGDLRIESELGKGSTFLITLPKTI
jgi:two-component system phosphate regulon sensor histidine kinase PhoR